CVIASFAPREVLDQRTELRRAHACGEVLRHDAGEVLIALCDRRARVGDLLLQRRRVPPRADVAQVGTEGSALSIEHVTARAPGSLDDGLGIGAAARERCRRRRGSGGGGGGGGGGGREIRRAHVHGTALRL